MSETEQHRVDRSGWPNGPWDSEPDRDEWRAHGLPCLIVDEAEKAARAAGIAEAANLVNDDLSLFDALAE